MFSMLTNIIVKKAEQMSHMIFHLIFGMKNYSN